MKVYLMSHPDICIFMSDQHNALVSGFAGDKLVRTPNLDRLAEQGTVFDAAYAACPLCVPSRVSFMTGQMSCLTGVYSNDGAIRGDQPTWAHALGAAGYDTVLVGRMHFVGVDQRCGFSRRRAGDCCDAFWGASPLAEEFRGNMGEYCGTRNMSGCLNIIGGGGVSPVLKYDDFVIREMLDELALAPDIGKPRCVLGGIYAPHFPYVAPRELYEYYRSRVELPRTFSSDDTFTHQTVNGRQKRVTPDVCLSARAAYYAMVENMDRQIGEVYCAWEQYLQRSGREGIFIYLSDHGDTLGEHHIYGKQTHFEGSARIPVVACGSGIRNGQRVSMPVSITDIYPTICDFAGAETAGGISGCSLRYVMEDSAVQEANRSAICEWIDWPEPNKPMPSRMVRRGKWKYIVYCSGNKIVSELLFDLDADPTESTNVSGDNPLVIAEMKALALDGWNSGRVAEQALNHRRNVGIMRQWAKNTSQIERNLCLESSLGLRVPELLDVACDGITAGQRIS